MKLSSRSRFSPNLPPSTWTSSLKESLSNLPYVPCLSSQSFFHANSFRSILCRFGCPTLIDYTPSPKVSPSSQLLNPLLSLLSPTTRNPSTESSSTPKLLIHWKERMCWGDSSWTFAIANKNGLWRVSLFFSNSQTASFTTNLVGMMYRTLSSTKRLNEFVSSLDPRDRLLELLVEE